MYVGRGGCPRLLANSSLNSRLGTQHGPAQSPPAAWRDSREPWPGLRSPAGVSSSFPCFSHRHYSDRCSLEREGAGKERFGVQSSPRPAGGHRVLILRLASPLGSSSLGGRGQPLGGPAEFGLPRGTRSPELGAWSRGGVGRLRVVQVEGGKSGAKTWAVENKEVRRREPDWSACHHPLPTVSPGSTCLCGLGVGGWFCLLYKAHLCVQRGRGCHSTMERQRLQLPDPATSLPRESRSRAAFVTEEDTNPWQGGRSRRRDGRP